MLNAFIIGSDINVGTTFITAGLAATMQSLGYQTCVYNPVQTGVIEKNGFAQSLDSVFIKSIDPYIKTASSYFLKSNFIPCISAEIEGVRINKNNIQKDYLLIQKDVDCIISECKGGLMTPLASEFFVSDLVKELDIPLVVIVRPGLGVINQTLLTINHAKSKGINMRGVIINNFSDQIDNSDFKNIPRLIEEYSDTKILGVVRNFENIQKIDPNNLITDILNGIDIESVFDVRISKLDID